MEYFKYIFIFGKIYSVKFYLLCNPNNDGYIPKYYILNEDILFNDDEFKKYFKTIEEFREERLNKLIK